MCRACGANIYFIRCEDVKTAHGAADGDHRWLMVNRDLTLHVCPYPTRAKIYSEDEKKEFARRRLAGEV